MVAEMRSAATYMTNQELANAFRVTIGTVTRITSGIRKPVLPHSAVGKGRVWEDWFANEAESRGMKVERQLVNAPFDLLINGHRVDVKSCFGPVKAPSTRSTGRVWKWGIKGRGADFYALIIVPAKDVFIVPVNSLPATAQILITWPNNWSRNPKYGRYMKAWHLLKPVPQD